MNRRRLAKAIAKSAKSAKSDIQDRRSLPLFQEQTVGPTMFHWAPASLDAFIANIPQSRYQPIVLFPPNTPLGRLQRAYGVNRAMYERDLP